MVGTGRILLNVGAGYLGFVQRFLWSPTKGLLPSFCVDGEISHFPPFAKLVPLHFKMDGIHAQGDPRFKSMLFSALAEQEDRTLKHFNAELSRSILPIPRGLPNVALAYC